MQADCVLSEVRTGTLHITKINSCIWRADTHAAKQNVGVESVNAAPPPGFASNFKEFILGFARQQGQNIFLFSGTVHTGSVVQPACCGIGTGVKVDGMKLTT
jgi:hypothetical protein